MTEVQGKEEGHPQAATGHQSEEINKSLFNTAKRCMQCIEYIPYSNNNIDIQRLQDIEYIPYIHNNIDIQRLKDMITFLREISRKLLKKL